MIYRLSDFEPRTTLQSAGVEFIDDTVGVGVVKLKAVDK